MRRCGACGARVDAGFDVCWKCGADRAGKRDEAFRPIDGPRGGARLFARFPRAVGDLARVLLDALGGGYLAE